MAQLSENVRTLAHDLREVTGDRRLFGSYLKQAVALLGDETVVARFWSFDAGYANVAMLTPHYVIDVEGDDKDNSGCLAICLLRSLESVALYEGPVGSIPGTSKESLALVMNPDSEPSSLWWVAEDDEEKADLQSFACSLLAAVRSLEEASR